VFIKIVAIGVVPENRRPSSSMAEFCMFLDAALAVTIAILTLRSMILLVGETPSAGKVDHARTFHQVPARVAGKVDRWRLLAPGAAHGGGVSASPPCATAT